MTPSWPAWPSRLVTSTIPACPGTGRSQPRPSATQVPAPARTCGSSALSIDQQPPVHPAREVLPDHIRGITMLQLGIADAQPPAHCPHPCHQAGRSAADTHHTSTAVLLGPECRLQRQPGLPASAQAVQHPHPRLAPVISASIRPGPATACSHRADRRRRDRHRRFRPPTITEIHILGLTPARPAAPDLRRKHPAAPRLARLSLPSAAASSGLVPGPCWPPNVTFCTP